MAENKLITAETILIFKLKLEGNTYEQIAATEGVNLKEKTLEAYFAKAGKFYLPYQEWAKARIEEMNEQISQGLQSQAVLAFQKMVTIAAGKANSMVTLVAAKDILDRSGYKPPEKVVFDSPDSLAKKILDHYDSTKKIEEKKDE